LEHLLIFAVPVAIVLIAEIAAAVIAGLRKNFGDIALYFAFVFAVLYLIQGTRCWRMANALRSA
jgi:hypothetical protein